MFAGSILASDAPFLAKATSASSGKDDPYLVESPTPKIACVFIAQTHVLPPDSEYFRLVSNRDALIEVQAYSRRNAISPAVVAILKLKGKTLELPLMGPAVLPLPPKVDPHIGNHSFKDSFTAAVPKEWIMPGLAVDVEMRERAASAGQIVIDRKSYPTLNVGAPNKMDITMFDIHFFGEGKGDYPEGWLPELQTKLPVSEMDLRRVHNIIFNKIVMQPRDGKPAVLCSSRKEYEEKTSIKFDGETGLAISWNHGLKNAAYQRANKFGERRYFYINMYGVPCGGVGGGFSGVGNGKDVGILLHEMGHSWGLPHWTSTNYPYFGTLYGIPGDSPTTPHVGPTWAFDIAKLVFIPPIVQENRAIRGTPGNFKRDPMLGGGEGDQEKGYLLRYFSDFSMHRIQRAFEKMMVYDDKTRKNMIWSDETGSYSKVVNGKYADWLPAERDVDVITILAAASGVTAEANIVYTPIGPYKSDLVELFEVPNDVARASSRNLDETWCNLCFRVTQNGTVKTYLAEGKINSTDNPADAASLQSFAINLPARNGKVTQVELLHAPNVFKNGNTDGAKVLFAWKASEHPEVELQTTEYFLNGKKIDELPGSKSTMHGQPAVAANSKAPAVPSASITPVSHVNAKPSVSAKAQEHSKSTVPESVRAEWFGKLIKKIDDSARDKKPLKGWITFGGKPGNHVLAGADDKVVKIEYEKNIMDVRWAWLKPTEQTALAKSLAREDDVESLMLMSVFFLSDGRTEEGEDVLARAALMDASAVAKLREQLK